FSQGDRERQLGLPISPLFDRAKQGVSKSQVGFYDFVGLPLAHALSSAFPGTLPLMRCFATNYNHWRSVDGQPPLEAAAVAASNGLSKAGGGASSNHMMPAPTGRKGPSPSPAVARLATCSEAPPPPPQTLQAAAAPSVAVAVSD
ncbi:cAMP-specific 3',5'-cyclic phosphodiesterase 4A, partial [Tetrabaena socialis]